MTIDRLEADNKDLRHTVKQLEVDNVNLRATITRLEQENKARSSEFAGHSLLLYIFDYIE